jgi:hypothetical protein
MKVTRQLKLYTTLLVLLAPAVAAAGVELSATEVTSYELPSGLDLGQAQIQATRDGTTVIAATIGDPTTANCTVQLADADRAVSFEYQYEAGPTACVGVIAHPDGGFFVRGAEADAEEGDVSGFTARIDADGTELWVVPDQQLADDPDFKGVYDQPHPEMAFSPGDEAQAGRLLGFTAGSLNIPGGSIRMTQAHVIGGDDGRLKENAKSFGSSGSAGFVAETTTRISDGDFLLYIYDAGSQGAHFFSYDGRSGIDAFEPLGEDWSQRYVRQMVYGPDDNVHLLWTPKSDASAPTNVTVVASTEVDDVADEIWSASWPSSIDNPDGDEPIELGTPLGMWVGSEYSLVLYNTGQELLMRVADAATGEELGVAPLAGLTDLTPKAIVNGADGTLELLALDESNGHLHELRLDISVTADEGDADAGGDAGLGDAGLADASSDSSSGQDDGCATSAPAAPAPVSGAVLAFLLAVFTIAHRKGFVRLPTGDQQNG